MIPVDLSTSCEGRIYDPNGSGIQILGIRSRDPYPWDQIPGSIFGIHGHVCPPVEISVHRTFNAKAFERSFTTILDNEIK